MTRTLATVPWTPEIPRFVTIPLPTSPVLHTRDWAEVGGSPSPSTWVLSSPSGPQSEWVPPIQVSEPTTGSHRGEKVLLRCVGRIVDEVQWVDNQK